MRGSSSPPWNALAWPALVSALATPAHADELSPSESIELSWSGPGTEAACIGGEGLTRAVNEYLGRHAVSSPPGELSLGVRVERQKSGWRALIQLTDQRSHTALGERELITSDPRCSGLDEPLKLAVALLVDGELAQVASSEAEKPSEPPPPPPPEPEEPASEPEREPPAELPLFPSRGWLFTLDGSLASVGGVLPATAVGVDLALDASPLEWLSLRAHGAGFMPQTLSPGGDTQVRSWFVFGGAEVCPRTTWEPGWAFLGCFGWEFGRLGVSRRGLRDGRDGARSLVMGSAGGRLSYQLSKRWAIGAQLSALLPLKQDRFWVNVDGKPSELFEVSVVPWFAGLGVSSSL